MSAMVMQHADAVREQSEKIVKLRACGLTIEQLAARFSVSTHTIKRLLKEELKKSEARACG